MIITYVTNDKNTAPYWYAESEDSNYDGIGPTPLEAVCAMINQMEKELKL